MREAQGALPLDPTKETFEKSFLGTFKTFYQFLSWIFNGSVLSERNRFPYGAPSRCGSVTLGL
jgi:hypothetical protein